MKRKTGSSGERRQENWVKHILLEKDYTEACAKWMAERIEALVEHMQYGHALIAYRKQNGEFQLVRATLVYYEEDFKRPYDANRIQSTVVYWNTELQGWRTFQLENFMEWRVIM